MTVFDLGWPEVVWVVAVLVKATQDVCAHPWNFNISFRPLKLFMDAYFLGSWVSVFLMVIMFWCLSYPVFLSVVPLDPTTGPQGSVWTWLQNVHAHGSWNHGNHQDPGEVEESPGALY